MNLWSKFKKLFEIKKCEGCGELPSRLIEHGWGTQNYKCRCDMYEMACKRPVRFKKESYVIDVTAKDIQAEEELRKEADRMFENQKDTVSYFVQRKFSK
jgi:transcription initiation factor IIF auxiliary subunit